MCYDVTTLLCFLDTYLSIVKGKGKTHTDLLKLRNFEVVFGFFDRINPAKERYLKGQRVH